LEIDESATTVMVVSGGYQRILKKKVISGLETVKDSIVFMPELN
jgi:hypothetical protein